MEASPKEADKKADEYLNELENPYVSFESVAEAWEEEHQSEIAYKTWMGYQAHYKAVVTAFGEMDIKELSHIEITNMLQTMAKQKYADKTVRTRLNVCNMIMQHALYEGYIKTNPCDIVRMPKGLKKGKRELPSDDEISKVMSGLNCHFGLFAYFLLFTGLRRGEALAIKWDDIDFETKTMYVHNSVYFENNKPKLKSTKTMSGVRTVPLLKPLANVLQNIEPKQGYLFGGEQPITEQTFRRAWERYTKESCVTVTPHQLRHAFATILFDADINAKSAQKMLGHADYKTTVEIYTHISEKRESSDVEKLNEFLAKI